MKVAITFTSQSSAEGVNELIKNIGKTGAKAIKIQADLRQVEAPEKVIQATRSAFGDHVDILVSNAGCELTKRLEDVSVADFSYVYDLNVRAVLLMSKAVLPYLHRPGRIVNMSSVGARTGLAGLSLYCSSKAAIEGLTRCLAAELGPKGHTVNAVEPGPVPTDMLKGIQKDIVELQKKSTLPRTD